VDGAVKKRVEDVMPIATGHEREELEAELEVIFSPPPTPVIWGKEKGIVFSIMFIKQEKWTFAFSDFWFVILICMKWEGKWNWVQCHMHLFKLCFVWT